MASMYEKVVSVISKPHSERTKKETEGLIQWFRNKSELFSTMKTDIVIDIISNCQLSTKNLDDVIIKQGERGHCFYVILKGSVSIYINNAISDEEDPTVAEEKSKQTDTDQNEKKELDRSKFGNYIVNLTAGKSFGELALINKDCIRNASIITDEETDFIVVDRALYNRSLRAAQVAEFAERTEFVTNSPLFALWHPKYKKQLSFSLRRVKVNFDGALVKQGEPVDALYFLRSGQAKLVVDSQQHSNQYPQLYPLEDHEMVSEKEEDNLVGNVKKKVNQVQYDRPVSVTPSCARRRETMKKLVEVSIIGVNDIIGDAECILEMDTYLQSVICTESSVAFALDMKNYERLVQKRNPRSIEMIRAYAEMKVESRVTRLQTDQIPLLKTVLFKLKIMGKPAHIRKKEKKPKNEANFHDIIPKRGALIDQHGPGTLFYRNRMREKSKMKMREKNNNFRSGMGFGRTPAATNHSLVMVCSQSLPPDSGTVGGDSEMRDAFLTNKDKHTEALENKEEYSDTSDQENGPMKMIRGYEQDAIFNDFETSDHAMSQLEAKIKDWHSNIITNIKNSIKVDPTVGTNPKIPNPMNIKLKRLDLKDGNEPVPGCKIMLRRRHHETQELAGVHHLEKEVNQNVVKPNRENTHKAIHSRRIQGTQEIAFMARALYGSYKPMLTSRSVKSFQELSQHTTATRDLSTSSKSSLINQKSCHSLDSYQRVLSPINRYLTMPPGYLARKEIIRRFAKGLDTDIDNIEQLSMYSFDQFRSKTMPYLPAVKRYKCHTDPQPSPIHRQSVVPLVTISTPNGQKQLENDEWHNPRDNAMKDNHLHFQRNETIPILLPIPSSTG